MKKEQIYAVQGVCSAVGAWLSAKLGILFPLLMVFAALMIVDQISGLLASKREALDHPDDSGYGWSSVKFSKGIYKKFGYMLTVTVAMLVDFVIFSCAGQMGVSIQTNTMFGLLCTVWFILNELLSITENAGRMGASLPAFLLNVLSVMKTKVEKTGNEESEEKEV